MVVFYKIHAWLKRRKVKQPKKQRENVEEEVEEEKWSRGCRVVTVNHFLRHFSY